MWGGSRYASGLRFHEQQQVAATQDQINAQIDNDQKALEQAMKAALGQEAPYYGGQVPKPAVEAFAEMQKARIDLKLTPVLDGTGQAVGPDDMQLEGSYSKRTRHTASKKLAQDRQTLNDLGEQVRLASMPAMSTTLEMFNDSLTMMTTVGDMIRHHRGMKWTDLDYELVRRLLECQSRHAAAASLGMGLLGAYEAVVDHGADPKIIEDVAHAGIQALPLEGKASLDDAKKYVANYEPSVYAMEDLYDKYPHRKTGNAMLDHQQKLQMDTVFVRAQAATNKHASSGTPDDIPGFHQLKLVYEGAAALKAGDPSKALSIASELAPTPGVRSALESASAAAGAEQKVAKTN